MTKQAKVQSKEVRDLKVNLTKEERLELYEKASEHHDTANEIERELKAHATAQKEEISRERGQAEGFRRIADNGEELRSVECVKVMNFKAKRVTVTRTDTGEAFEDREMYESEKQMEMADDDEPPYRGYAYCGKDGLPVFVDDTEPGPYAVMKRTKKGTLSRITSIEQHNDLDVLQKALDEYASAKNLQTCCRICGATEPTRWDTSDLCGDCADVVGLESRVGERVRS